jgi:TRAP-type C4-dicarboxylate transport system substrate-binding protein
MHSRSKKVVVPGDVKGMKIRPAHATMAAWVTQLGGTNISVSPAEIRDVLEKGVADATTTPWGSVLLFGIDKVTKYHLDIPLATTTFQWIMNPKVYESMSAAQKKVIDDHCTNDWAAKFADAWADFEAGGADKLRNAAGHEIVSVTPDQLKEWKASGEPVYKSWADAVRKGGGDPDAILKDLRAALNTRQVSEASALGGEIARRRDFAAVIVRGEEVWPIANGQLRRAVPLPAPKCRRAMRWIVSSTRSS